MELDPHPDETPVGIVEGRRERKSGKEDKEDPTEVEEVLEVCFFFPLLFVSPKSTKAHVVWVRRTRKLMLPHPGAALMVNNEL